VIWNAIADEDSSAQIRSVGLAREEFCTLLSTITRTGMRT
jgi:hypothetical protein